jgi:hypothetical protein
MSQINESAIATPGVYINEIDSFPPSVAQVATAIPVFIGYTEKALDANGKNVTNQLVHISSLVEYIKYFGEGPALTAVVYLNSDNTVNNVVLSPSGAIASPPTSPLPVPVTNAQSFQMFNTLQMFFNQGGGDCYILSVGPYATAGTATYTDFIPTTGFTCFDIVQKNDVITLIVIPDAVMLTNPNDFNNLMAFSLNLCGKLQDRFAIMDVYNGFEDRTYDSSDVITNFRSGVGSLNLEYGAAYYPWLNTSLTTSFSFQDQNIVLYIGDAVPITKFTNKSLSDIISGNPFVTQILAAIADQQKILDAKLVSGTTPLQNLSMPAINNKTDLQTVVTDISKYIDTFVALTGFTDTTPATQNGLDTSTIYQNYIVATATGTTPTQLENLMEQLILINTDYPVGGGLGATVTDYSTTHANLPTLSNPYVGTLTTDAQAVAAILSTVKNVFNGVINLISNFINDVANLINSDEVQLTATNTTYANIVAAANAGVLVPPSGAIAGVYAAVDATRGVWKAPANVSLNTVISPAVNIDDDMQGDLNIDTNAGKSINAIRSFTGKGILVWGSRTLDGNDNNWRYVPVRRFFIMVEESVKLAAFQFVFEPNVSSTWLRIKAMIENYLTGLWRLGAITGAKPEQGFYVKVGLGQTMTQDDILNGRLIVEVGIAPVRPAEFIILRFTQTQQQA